MMRVRKSLAYRYRDVCRLIIRLVVIMLLVSMVERSSTQGITEGHVEEISSSSPQTSHKETSWVSESSEDKPSTRISLTETPWTSGSPEYTPSTRISSTTSHFPLDGNRSDVSTLCTEMENFALKFNLCGEQLRELPGYHSCRNRCGVRPSLAESSERCSCDYICFVYGDCCLDIHSKCPGMREVFQKKFLKISEASPAFRCSLRNEYKYIVKNKVAQTTSSSPELSTSINRLGIVTFNHAWGGLKEFLQLLPQVYDQSTGLLHLSDATYKTFKDEGSSPHYVPYIIQVPGVYTAGNSIDTYVFHFQWNSDMMVILDPELRPSLRGCLHYEEVSCESCVHTRRISLRDLCLGVNRNEHNSFTQSFRGGDILHVDGSCQHVSPPTPRQSDPEMRLSQRAIKLQVLARKDGNRVVRLTGAPWKELLCSGSVPSLDECEIQTCAFGYFFTKGQSPCHRPRDIDVTIVQVNRSGQLGSVSLSAPACTCLLVYTAILKVDVLELKNIPLQSHLCSFQSADIVLNTGDFMNAGSVSRKGNQTLDGIIDQRALSDQENQAYENCNTNGTASEKSLSGHNGKVGDWACPSKGSTDHGHRMTIPEFYSSLMGTLNSLDICDDAYDELIVCLDEITCTTFYKNARGFHDQPVTSTVPQTSVSDFSDPKPENDACRLQGTTWFLVIFWTLHLYA